MAEQITASYFVVMQTVDGPTQWMWNCEGCPAVGLAETEPEVVAAMNDHVDAAHPKSDYTPTPVPE